jgi:hypothetical protein
VEFEEIWEDVKGYEGLYQVSNMGRVKSLARIVEHPPQGTLTVKEKILTPSKNRVGYLQVRLSKSSTECLKYIHRLVAEAFILNPDNKPQVNHISGRKNQNDIKNLEWSSRSSNIKRFAAMYRLGFKITNLSK